MSQERCKAHAWKVPGSLRVDLWEAKLLKLMGRKVTGPKLCASKDSLLWNLRKNLPFLLWFVYTISINV